MSKKSEKVKVEVGNKEAIELEEQLARALADYDNLRKRTEAEKEIWIKFASERILSKLVSILDVLNSAQEHLKDQGLGIAINEFSKMLKEEGLEEIRPTVGDKFDENIMEAIEVVEAENPEQSRTGKIAELTLPGWKFSDGPVIRVAKVKVYK